VAVTKAEVKLPTGTLRETGEYDIDLQLHSEVTAIIKLVIIQQA
jgi:large subunit ribosomal protein L9